MSLLFHLAPSRVELWPSKHKKLVFGHFVRTCEKPSFFSFTILLQPPGSQPIVHSIGGNTAARRQMCTGLYQGSIRLALNTLFC